MKTTLALSALALLAAGCGAQPAVHAGGDRAAALGTSATQSTRLVSALAGTTSARCPTSSLSLRLGPAGHAAGSVYRPIRFTNTGSTACTLYGYPGVSYVAPKTGKQVGAAASRDPAVKPHTVTLAPGGHAAALLQLVNYLGYPADHCAAKTVSGLRVYPPGSKAAAYIPFAHHRKACSTNVQQLNVRAVVAGTSGQ